MIKKYSRVKMLSIMAAIILIGAAAYYFAYIKTAKGDVVLHGKLMQFSGSGSMKFYYYDVKSDKISESWFWAMPNVDEKVKIDNFVKFVGDNRDSVFKIVGTKGKDDCGYTEGVCIEDMIVSEISLGK